MKYVKKPIPVEAFCPAEDTWPEWFRGDGVTVEFCDGEIAITIPTIEGLMSCRGTDYIIKGVDGELYPCHRDIFLKTYEKVEEDN